MINFGAVPAGSVLPVLFSSYDANGASVTLSGLAVTDIEIYKGTSMTQRASDAGYTLLDTDGIDIDTITGLHGFSIDLGDNTDAGFFAVGSFYTVVVSAVTVSAQTVNFIAATFRIVAAEAVAGKPKVDVDAWLGTAAATPSVAGVPEVDVTHVGGTVQTAGDLKASLNTIDDFLDTEIAAILAAVDTEVAAILSDTNAILVDTGTTLQAELDGIQADTEDIQTRLPAALVSGRIDASVGAMAANVLTATAIASGAITAAKFAAGALDAVWSTASRLLTAGTNIALAKGTGVTGFNDLSTAQVNAEVVDALATDTYAEPGQGAPAATASLAEKLNYLYKAWRNKKTQTATTHSLYDDTEATVDQKSTTSDDGTTATRGEMVSGP